MRYTEDRRPRVFISYSWTTPELRKWVREIATELRASWGIDVILDEWEMKAGNDMNHFMEESVRSADKVLVVCDLGYQTKAGTRRSSGVSTETQIISPEVYADAKQEKFIPVFYEKDENGAPFVPAYLKSRLGFDLSNVQKQEENIRGLVETIYEVQRKPELGPLPKFERDEPMVRGFQKNKIISTCLYEERIIWLLPRGFLFIYDIAYREDPNWTVKANYVKYDGEFMLGVYHETGNRESSERYRNGYRALKIPPADWELEEYHYALTFVLELRERPEYEELKALALYRQGHDQHVYYYGPGEPIYLPSVPEKFKDLYDTGELRDIKYKLLKLHAGNLSDPQRLVIEADALRYDLRTAAHKYLAEDPHALSAISDVINDFNAKCTNDEMFQWLERAAFVLGAALKRVIGKTTFFDWLQTEEI